MVVALASGSAAAATYDSGSGPSWQTICMGAVAVLGGLIAAYVRGMQSRVEKLEENTAKAKNVDKLEIELAALNLIVNRDYHTKPELERLIDRAIAPITRQVTEVKESMDTLHARFDNLRIVRTKHHGDEEH
jgi:hypothetical protein